MQHQANVYYISKVRAYMILLVCLGILLISSMGYSQNNCVNKDKKAAKLYEKGVEQISGGHYQEAEQYMKQALEINREYVEVIYELANLYYTKAIRMREDPSNLIKRAAEFNKAMSYFLAVIEICPQYEDYSAYFYAGILYNNKNDRFNAENYLSTFDELCKVNNAEKKEAKRILKVIRDYYDLMENPVDFDPVFVKGVCTEHDEYLPMVSPDGKYAYYTHRYYEKEKYEDRVNYKELFTVSERVNSYDAKQDEFTKGTPMPSPFNDGRNQGGAALTIDNRTLYLTICEKGKIKDFSGQYKIADNCDIYVSQNNNGQWSVPYNLGANINSPNTWESQPSISSDGKTLYFVSMREGNIGWDPPFNATSDIYYSTKDENGNWSPAKNMGSTINTEWNENAPFMHSDSKTLYFSSDGHLGIGGYDIFFSKMNKSGNWSAPKNLGYPINNEYDNIGLIVSTYANKAFFSSREFQGPGGFDVFSFVLPKEARPEKVMLVKGDLKDDKGKPVENAKIEIKGVVSQKVIEGIVDEKSGKYAVAVAMDENEDYLMTVKKEDYAFTSSYIKQTEEIAEKPIEIAMEMKPVKEGQTVEIKDINFATNSYTFDEASMVILESFAEFLLENPKIKIEIHGHTDNIGVEKENKILSEKRAKSVRSYLMLMGVEKDRMPKCVGFGSSKPLASNKTEEGRARNRRTEFVIVKK